MQFNPQSHVAHTIMRYAKVAIVTCLFLTALGISLDLAYKWLLPQISAKSALPAETDVAPICMEEIKAETVGNHSYIHLNCFREPVTVLEAISKFEADHPDMEITHWQAEGWSGGIYIDHRPRAVKTACDTERKWGHLIYQDQ